MNRSYLLLNENGIFSPIRAKNALQKGFQKL